MITMVPFTGVPFGEEAHLQRTLLGIHKAPWEGAEVRALVWLSKDLVNTAGCKGKARAWGARWV